MTDLDRFLRRPEVEQTIGISRSMIYKMMAAGKFPKPVSLGIGDGVRWSAREVAEWQANRMAERGGSNPESRLLENKEKIPKPGPLPTSKLTKKPNPRLYPRSGVRLIENDINGYERQ